MWCELESAEERIDTISLQVSAQIIKHISAGLYRSPGSSIKELLSNAFDADATNVYVRFYFDYLKGELRLDRIVVRDDGNGMSIKNLYYVFTHIGGSEKNTPDLSILTPKKKRKVIGRLGIGMLSVASACRGFVVRTKKSEEEREYIAKISLAFFRDVIQRTESMDKTKLGNVDLFSKHVGGYDSYTEIEISDFTPPFLDSIVPTLTNSFLWKNPKKNSTDEEYFEGFIEYIQKIGKLNQFATLDRLVADVGCMSPVEYLPDGPVRKRIEVDGKVYEIPGTDSPEFEEIRTRPRTFDFNVHIEINKKVNETADIVVNSFKVFKPFLYPNKEQVAEVGFDRLDPYVYMLPQREDQIINDDGEYENAEVKGYYYHQSTRISPVEYSGMLFRVYNVALGNEFGDPMKFFVDTYMIYQQSLVEVFLDEGFQQTVNLDREGLFEGSNAYRYLRNYLLYYIRGDAPPERPQPTKENTQRAVVEKQFVNEQTQLFPEGRKNSIVSNVKSRRAKYRMEGIKSKTKELRQRIMDDYNVEELRIKKVRNLTDVSLVQDGDTLVAKIPTFSKRKELWELLCIGILHNLSGDDKERASVINFLVDLYKEVEEGNS